MVNLEDMETKEKIMQEFFTWLFDDDRVKDSSINLQSEVDLSLVQDYCDPKIYYPEQIGKFFKTKPMQRLGRVSQLSLTLNVFPNTYHTRLEHSKGVYNRKVEEFISLYQKEGWKKFIEDNNLKLYLIAELIKVAGHDVGHFPLSHTFEDQIIGKHGIHEVMVKRLMLEYPEIQTVLTNISDSLPDILSELYDSDILNFRSHDESSYDVDRLDYLSRDAMYQGLPEHFHTLNYSSFPSYSFDGNFTDAYPLNKLPEIEEFLSKREYGYESLYMSRKEQAYEGTIGALFDSMINDDSGCGMNLQEYIRYLKNTDLNDIDLEEFLKWDDISFYREILDIAENHPNENIRNMASLTIPQFQSFLTLIYSLLGCKNINSRDSSSCKEVSSTKGYSSCKEAFSTKGYSSCKEYFSTKGYSGCKEYSGTKGYSKEDLEFLMHIKSLIKGNSTLIKNLNSPNFYNSNIICLDNSPYKDWFIQNRMSHSFEYNLKAYNSKEPIFVQTSDGSFEELSNHPNRTRDWANSHKKIHYDYAYVPILKLNGVPEEFINKVKSADVSDITSPENGAKLNMSPLQTDKNIEDYFSDMEI